MPSKRTRSATVERPDGNSSDVTDYMGPPTTKRQKSTAQSANTSARVTRSTQAARVPAEKSQSKAASTHLKTRQEDVEDDDDDGSVHVAFNQVSSAVNKARLGQPRVTNGMQSEEREVRPNDVTEDEDGEGEVEKVGGQEEAMPMQKRGRRAKAKQTTQQKPLHNQQSRPANQQSRVGLTAGSSGKSAPVQTQQPQGDPERPRMPDEDGQQDDEESDFVGGQQNEEDIQGAAAEAAEDSAFIDAPRPDEKLTEVKRAVNSLGAMIKTLSHPAWTGAKNWDENPEMACSTQTGGKLIECLRQLNDVLLESYDARYEGDADGNPAVTIDYLRRNNGKVKRLLAETTGLVDDICTRKLIAVDNLGTRGVEKRKRFLSDITKRLMPMLVLVMQKAYDVGPSEEKGNVVHLTLNPFTIQFLLRTVGWASRLMVALSRGLVQWPIDDEFDHSDEDLDIVEVARKQGKIKKREMFVKQLASLYSAVTKAADILERQAREAGRKARQEQDRQREEQLRRQARIRGRELWAKNERERQEAEQRTRLQMEKFAQASQDLKSTPNPLAELWKQANQLLYAPATSQASAPNISLPSPRQSKAKERAIPQIDNDDDVFGLNDNEDHQFDIPVRKEPISSNHRIQDGVPRTINGLRTVQAREAWGAPRWTKEEEKRLLLRIRLDRSYNSSTMAPRLGRSSEDVARKAAELKAAYRAIYTKRGADIPAWAC